MVGMEHISESYAEYLEPESTVQIHGTLGDELAQTIDGASRGRTDEAATICEPSPASADCPQCDLPDANHSRIRWN
jgi:hypothetical protein